MFSSLRYSAALTSIGECKENSSRSVISSCGSGTATVVETRAIKVRGKYMIKINENLIDC